MTIELVYLLVFVWSASVMFDVIAGIGAYKKTGKSSSQGGKNSVRYKAFDLAIIIFVSSLPTVSKLLHVPVEIDKMIIPAVVAIDSGFIYAEMQSLSANYECWTGRKLPSVITNFFATEQEYKKKFVDRGQDK